MDLYFPSPVRVSGSQWDIVDAAGRFRSPLSGAARVIARQGDRWHASVILQNESELARGAMQSFILSMRGGVNSVWLKDHSYTKRGSFASSELLSNPTFDGTTGFTAGSEIAVTAQDNVARATRTAVSVSGSPEDQVARTFLYASGTTISGAAYVARAIVVKGKGYTPHTGFLSVRAGTSADGSELGTTAYDSFGLLSHVFVATGTTTYVGVRDADPEGVAAGDYVSIQYISLARCARVNGASQSGTGILLKNLPTAGTSPDSGVAGLLKYGDCVQIGNQYVMVTAPLNSAADGTGYLEFAPALRESPADNAAVIIHQPMARFGFSSETSGWTSRPGVFSDATLEFDEDLRGGFGALVAAPGPSIPSGQFDTWDIRYYDGDLAAAIAASTVVVLEPGETYTTSTITLTNGQYLTIFGNGATIKLANGTNAALINHADVSNGTVTRLAVYNTVFDGNKAGQTGGAWIANGGCIFGYFDQLIVRDCEFKNSYGGNIFIKHLTNEFVCDGCYFHDGAEHTGTTNQDSDYIAMQMSPTRTLTGLRSATITNFVMRGIVPGVAGRGVGGIIAASDPLIASYESHILKIANGTLIDCGQDAGGNVVAAIKLYRRCSQTVVDKVTVLGGYDNGIEVQGSDDVTVSNCTIRGLTQTGQSAIKFGTRDGGQSPDIGKTCNNMSVLNCNISNCPRGIDAFFDDTLPGRDIQIIGGQIENVDQAIRVRKVAGEIKIVGTKIYNVNDDTPTNLDHCISLGALSTDSTVTVDVIIDGVRVEDSENLIVNIRNITGNVSITNCHSKTIEDIRPINLIKVTGDVLISNNNLAGVINDIISLDTVTGRIQIMDNIGPAGATVRTTGGSVISSTYGNSWDPVLYGTYTPSLFSVTNVAASTPRLSTYIRVGNTVTVHGQCDVDPTGAGATELGISLPIASAFTTAFQCGGCGASTGVAGFSAGIDADATNDRARMRWVAVDIANQPVMFTFGYQVI